MTFLIFAMIGLASTATAQQPPAAKTVSHGERCTPSASMTAARPRPPRIHNLGEEPPANQLYAVYRRGRDGCPDPIVLRKGVGLNRDRQIEIAPDPQRRSAFR